MIRSKGRICLLGDHNDWAGNCSIAAAIEQGISFDYVKRPDNTVVMKSVNTSMGLNATERFLLGEKFGGNLMKYVEAVTRVLMKRGHEIGGVDMTMESNLPMKKGLSSSAALSVGATRVFNEIFSLGLSIDDIIDIAYTAEHDLLGIGCGKMDQTASAYGGVVYIEFNPFSVQPIVLKKHLHLVLGQTGGDRDTKKILNTLNHHFFEKKDEEILKAFQTITEITKRGRDALEKGDTKLLGQMMDRNQEQYDVLRRFCDELDSKRLYTCIGVSKDAGALGAKWTGAGGNGSFIALAEDEEKQEAIARELEKEGVLTIKTNIF